jgi:ankyrin repeat protein
MIKSLAAVVYTASMLASAQALSGESVNQYPLHVAAGHDDVSAIERLVSEGAEIEARDASGSTALLIATRANKVNAARALIEAGADVNAKDRINDSAYLYAGAQGYLEILKMALAHGADLQSTNRYGGTALIPAAERGHVETVRALIEAGVAVDHINKLGWTALLEAIILGSGGERHEQIVNMLLKAGANPNLADREGATPLQHARSHGYRNIESVLLAAGGH